MPSKLLHLLTLPSSPFSSTISFYIVKLQTLLQGAHAAPSARVPNFDHYGTDYQCC
ncbi:hypothetical protein Lalb_Chr09g0331991 [Lupinus albus]|uniref:Uncharacterized protein n=1 Tax=Lupinus albus TaxID=3870 RepID=A0A6A4Q1U4_LUPAL|nr:hypothetical protein Lalb_Chr09g0331991 [Lupinus albus]